jgi:hypothetical protein
MFNHAQPLRGPILDDAEHTVWKGVEVSPHYACMRKIAVKPLRARIVVNNRYSAAGELAKKGSHLPRPFRNRSAVSGCNGAIPRIRA